MFWDMDINYNPKEENFTLFMFSDISVEEATMLIFRDMIQWE